MKLVDDCKEAERHLAGLASGWKKVEHQLEYLADYWPSICSQLKGFRASIEPVSPAPWRMNGKVLGKEFSILVNPLAVEGEQGYELYAELLVLVPTPLEGTMVNAARILLDRELAVYSAPGRKLAEGGNDTVPFRLLVSILGQVLSTETA